MVLLHFRVGLSLYVIPNRALRESEAPLPPFKGEHLERTGADNAVIRVLLRP